MAAQGRAVGKTRCNVVYPCIPCEMEPADDAPSWRKELFSLLYAHLQRLKKGS